ncbi:MAG: hypothetical protein RLZZ512_595 [Bacteroidota bacterium]
MKCLVVGACFLGSVEAVDGSADRFVDGVVNEVIDSVRLQDKAELALLNNPGYMGLTQAVTVMGVTNFTGLFRTPAKYQTNVFINYEIARRPSLSWQFGFKSIQRTMDNADFSDYGTYVFAPSSGWGNSLNYKPYGTMDIGYQEFTVGAKNYLQSTGSTAPFGGYLVVNLHYGLASSSANNLTWSDYYSGQTLPSVGTAGVSGSLVSMSYGFGFRNVLFDQVGVVFEMTSGLTMLNSGGFSVYTLDNYTGNYHGVNQADVMRRVMLREFHKSQWLQFKLGVGYLF